MHFGVISPPVSGHLHPFGALGRELIARGHRVTCFQVRDLEHKILGEGLEFVPIGHTDHPVGSLPASLAELGRRKGLSALRFTIAAVERTTEMTCRDAPDAIARAGVGALLVDQTEPAGAAIADFLRLPYVTVCNALLLNRDPVTPPPFTPWRYRQGAIARVRNAVGYAVSDWLTRGVIDIVARYRRRWSLPAWDSPDASFSSLAQICQMPRAFDFPRQAQPSTFHYVGPLRRQPTVPVTFPWERLDGRPLVYASLGTLQNSREALFRTFAEACARLDVQLVMSHGGGLTASQVDTLPGGPLVVSYAPQLELLAKASLTVTHAGLNTVLDSLANGVPLVAVPITYEQPAIARRVEWCGAGRSIALNGLTPVRLASAIREVMRSDACRTAARGLAAAIADAGGVRRAADLVEAAAG